MHQIRPHQLQLRQITRPLVLGFLDWPEGERQNSNATRNQRLAALRAFGLYVQPDSPEHLQEWQRILAIPTKKKPRPLIPFLTTEETTEEMKILLQQPLPGTRDQVLLATWMMSTVLRTTYRPDWASSGPNWRTRQRG